VSLKTVSWDWSGGLGDVLLSRKGRGERGEDWGVNLTCGNGAVQKYSVGEVGGGNKHAFLHPSKQKGGKVKYWEELKKKKKNKKRDKKKKKRK